MKKIAIAKLRLNRETLRALDSGSLQHVAAGRLTFAPLCTYTCAPSDPNGKTSVAAAGCN